MTEALSVKVWLQGKPVIMHNIYRVKDSVNLTSILSSSTPSFIAGDFNAHHTLWCKKTDRAGRELLAQIEDNQQYVIKNEMQTPTTQYNTTIDLTIVHTSIAATCSWSIYDTLKSDHYAVLATLNTGKILPQTTSVRKWCFHKADWQLYQNVIEKQLQPPIDDLDCEEGQLMNVMLEAAKISIPTTNPTKIKKQYWCYDSTVRQYRWTLNRANKTLRKITKLQHPNLEAYKASVQEATRNYYDSCEKARYTSWDTWLTKNNTELNPKKLWQRNNRCTGIAQREPQHPCPLQHGLKLLDDFVARSSSSQFPADVEATVQQHRPARVQLIDNALRLPSECDRPITCSEINAVLKTTKDTSPGEDTLSYSMVEHAPICLKQRLAELYTKSLSSGKLPSRWKTAVIVPVPKKNNTYRPISLLSVLSKIMEKIILQRLRWLAAPPHVMATGFKPGSGTRDAVSVLIHDLSEGKSFTKPTAAAVYIDLKRAFELVSKEVILAELSTAGVTGAMLSWMSDFLFNRMAKVRFQGTITDEKCFENGTPQGSSLSPTIFNYAMNVFLRLQLPEGVRIMSYADDLVIYCVHRKNIIPRLQDALNQLSTTAAESGFFFAPEKTHATWFFGPQPAIKLRICNKDIEWADNNTYLGVVIDKNLTMKPHVDHVINKASRSINALKVMSTLSGVNAKILKGVYQACVKASLGYGTETFNLLSSCQQKRLQVKQNTALKLVLGTPNWTPTVNIHSETNVLPIRYNSEIMQATMLYKILRNPLHPLHIYISAEIESPRTAPRYARTWTSTICNKFRKLCNSIPDLEAAENIHPWSVPRITTHTNNHLPPKHSTDATTLLSATNIAIAAIAEPDDANYYTDGSVRDGQVAAAVVHQHGTISVRLNDSATIMQAELLAIYYALHHAQNIASRCVVYSDSKSAVVAITERLPKDNITLIRQIQHTASKLITKPLLVWIPSHIGIPGNEAADALANAAIRRETVDVTLPISMAKSKQSIQQTARDIYETLAYDNPSTTVAFHQKVALTNTQRKATLNIYNRATQRSLYRLRLFVKPYSQLVHKEKATCSYCGECYVMYTVHYLTVCPVIQLLRYKLMADVPIELYHTDNTTLTIEILRRQAARNHRELLEVVQRYPIFFFL